jgi:hypothetical protein
LEAASFYTRTRVRSEKVYQGYLIKKCIFLTTASQSGTTESLAADRFVLAKVLARIDGTNGDSFAMADAVGANVDVSEAADIKGL